MKAKLDSLVAIKEKAYSAKIQSCDDLKKIDEKISSFNNFMLDFFSIISGVVGNLSFPNYKKSSKKLILVVSFDKKMSSLLVSNLKNKASGIFDDVDVFCIGCNVFEYFVKTGFNVVGYAKLDDDLSFSALNDVYDFLSSVISDKEYGDISLLFSGKKIVDGSELYNLYPLSREIIANGADNIGIDINSVGGDVPINISPCEFVSELEVQFAQYLLYGFVLQAKKIELEKRIGIIKGVILKTEFVVNDFTLSFNRAYQSLLAKEVSNIMSIKA